MKIFHPRTPLGPQNPYLGVRPPQNRIIAYFARKNYLPFSRSCRTLINLHTIPKQMDPTFFGSIFDLKTPKKRQKRAKFEKGKKESPYGSIFDLTSISKPKILEFYHTLRKTRHIDVKGEIGPIKVRPYFDRPNPTLNVNFPSFPQSMMKFKYFWVRNHCQIEFLTWDKLFLATSKIVIFFFSEVRLQ